MCLIGELSFNGLLVTASLVFAAIGLLLTLSQMRRNSRDIAVFVDKKPELIFRKKVERRESIVLDYRGGADSVYSEIAPQFVVKF